MNHTVSHMHHSLQSFCVYLSGIYFQEAIGAIIPNRFLMLFRFHYLPVFQKCSRCNIRTTFKLYEDKHFNGFKLELTPTPLVEDCVNEIDY